MNIMFSSHENRQKWLYDRADWEQTRKDLNAHEIINYFEKRDKDFPSEYLYKPCSSIEDAEYRLEIMREICENENLYNKLSGNISEFRQLRMLLRDYKEDKHDLQKSYRYLKLFCGYAELITGLKLILENADSQGLKKVYNYCESISLDNAFNSGREIADRLTGELSDILNNTGISINPQEKIFTLADCEEPGVTELLLAEIYEVYELNIKNYFSIVDPTPISYLEDQVLLMLTEKNPELFEDLRIFYEDYINILDDIKAFAGLLPQLIFYINYIEFIKLFESHGIKACRPEFDNIYQARGCASASLAVKFYYEELDINIIVRNNIKLPAGGKFILSGPNQGGKTIYLKQLGLTAYLAKCGCYVLCESCKLPFYDKIFTHFMQKEILGKSRLAEEIERIEADIMTSITRDSLVLLNESFTSTRRKDSVKICLHYLKKFDAAGCSVGFVSHFYELPEIYGDIISLRSSISENGERTYNIIEQQGDGLAYALDISRSCGTTYEQLSESLREYKTGV